jgi:hypothetical protein
VVIQRDALGLRASCFYGVEAQLTPRTTARHGLHPFGGMLNAFRVAAHPFSLRSCAIAGLAR